MTASFAMRPKGAQISKHAWHSVLDAFAAMTPLFLSAGALAVIWSLAMVLVPHLTPVMPRSSQGAITPAQILLFVAIAAINGLVWGVLAAPVAVAMHRFILKDETTPGILSFRPRHTRLFFFWALALQLAFLAATAIPLFLAENKALFGALSFVTALGMSILSVFLAMIFPAVATDVPSPSISARMETSMEQVSGNFWLFVRATIITFIPLLLFYLLVEIVFFRQMLALARSGGNSHDPMQVIIGVLFGLIKIPSVALAAAMASWLYAWVRQQPATDRP